MANHGAVGYALRPQRERDQRVVIVDIFTIGDMVVVTHVCSALTRMPTIRPNIAPTAMDGTKIPQGTLQPYETTTRAVLTTTARRSELTIRHCADVLRRQFPRGHLYPLAEPVVVSSALTLPKQNLHALRHVDPEEPVEIPDKRGDGRQGHRLGYAVIREVLSSERRHL
jgi:hypothetical protein